MASDAARSDYLIIGSGMAGLYAAVGLADDGDVTIVTKRGLDESNTHHAQGGIAAVFAGQDSFSQHVDDTLAAGAGLCRREVVEAVVAEGPPHIRRLIELGVAFTRTQTGELDLGREGGHTHHRIVHMADATGREVERALVERVRTHPRIRIREHHVAVDLLLDSRSRGEVARDPADDRCIGAFVMRPDDHAIEPHLAPVTLLATGGAGKAYLYTSNPDVATGDGLAMAYRAGVPLANLEFVQFHPTCLYHPVAQRFLISEAARGEGGKLTSLDGEEFARRYDPRGELASRDIVARAIDAEMKRRGDPYVLLHLEHLGAERIRRRFPAIYRRCLELGFDITRQPIPVVPAAHYMCGGVVTDLDAQTRLPGLLAAGEVAHTGMHGANRLASNSLLEAVVMAGRAVAAARKARRTLGPVARTPEWSPAGAVRVREAIVLEHDWNSVRALMSDYVGIVRADERLRVAAHRMRALRESIQEYFNRFLLTPDLVELRNLGLVAELIIACARTRTESRGLHYNLDHPDRDDDHWLRDSVVTKHGDPS